MSGHLSRNRSGAMAMIRSPENFAAGFVLLAIAAFGWIISADLNLQGNGTLGPGMLPRAMMVCVAICGVVLIAGSLRDHGPRLRLPDFSAALLIVALALISLPLGALLGGPGNLVAGLPPAMVVFVLLYAIAMLALVFISLRHPNWLNRSGLRGPVFVIGGILGFAMTVSSAGLLVAGPLLALISGAAAPDTRYRELFIFAVAITIFSTVLFKYVLQLPMPVLIIPGLIHL